MAGVWDWYLSNRDNVAPLLAPLGSVLVGLGTVLVGGLVAWAALRQARTSTEQAKIATEVARIANRQAEIAAVRHEEQTRSDRQRRITDTFSKAVEQLASEKVEVRLGGIYTLERLAGEALDGQQAKDGPAVDLYWTVMETLTAFVRERAPWKEPDTGDAKSDPMPGLGTDIAAVLKVIHRRPAAGIALEAQRHWRFDFQATDLRGANLAGIHLEGANLDGACLERANLFEAHLERAHLIGAHLEDALCFMVHFEDARLGAYRFGDPGAPYKDIFLETADDPNPKGAYPPVGAHLEGADLFGAHLEGASFAGVDLGRVKSLDSAFGDARTQLPDGAARPPHWPPYDPAERWATEKAARQAAQSAWDARLAAGRKP